MPVSILFSRADLPAALAISEHLRLEGVTTHLEAIDTQANDTGTLIALINRSLHGCTHVIILVSANTCGAWWVPFALGAAALVDRRLTSFTLGQFDSPGCLAELPSMHQAIDLDLFVSAYHLEHTLGLALHLPTQAAPGSNRCNAERFHTDLKARIGRGY